VRDKNPSRNFAKFQLMKSASLQDLLARLWYHLGPRRRRQFALLLLLMLLSAFAEVISLGAVLPFIAVLAAPDKVFQYTIVADLALSWGITSASQLVLPLTIAFCLAAILAGAMRILVIWLSTRLTFASGADLSIEIYRRTLYQPYRVHVARGSSETISGITGKVGHTTLGVLLPLLTLVSSCVLLVAIMFALIAINPVIALVATAGFGVTYGLITVPARRRLERNSQLIAEEHTRVVKALQEGLGGIRDVLLDGAQPVYCEVYRKADQRWRLAQGENAFIGQSPRFAMEALGMVLIAALAFGISRQSGGIAAALPMLGALALGAQRMLPAMQQGYAAWASIAGSLASFADTIGLLDQPLPSELLKPRPTPLHLQQTIRFDDVAFRYTKDNPWVLKKLNLTIAKGSRMGFVGSTGSGKSTLMDLLMGLLTPDEGEILVDGEPISGDRVRAWQQSIAHVPQSIFLSDSTFAENIAFGMKREYMDRERVRIAATRAQIADFIESGAEGYDAIVGERGVRLSGGQRQRIGIARALYKQASVLVLDEATSALDNATEQSVIEAIEGLERDLTILIIAHRLTTVKHCDSIVELEQGRIVAQGTYDQLIATSESFRKTAYATTAT
jgi:ATP-binding cassette subfamily B protein